MSRRLAASNTTGIGHIHFYIFEGSGFSLNKINLSKTRKLVPKCFILVVGIVVGLAVDLFSVIFFVVVRVVSLCRIFDCPFMVLITEVVSLSTPVRSPCNAYLLPNCLLFSFYFFFFPHLVSRLFDTIDASKVQTDDSSVRHTNRSNHLFSKGNFHAGWQTPRPSSMANRHQSCQLRRVKWMKLRCLWSIRLPLRMPVEQLLAEFKMFLMGNLCGIYFGIFIRFNVWTHCEDSMCRAMDCVSLEWPIDFISSSTRSLIHFVCYANAFAFAFPLLLWMANCECTHSAHAHSH